MGVKRGVDAVGEVAVAGGLIAIGSALVGVGACLVAITARMINGGDVAGADPVEGEVDYQPTLCVEEDAVAGG